MPKAYAVVSIAPFLTPKSLPPMPSSRARRSLLSGHVSLLAAMQQSLVNKALRSALSLPNIRT
jgi:hypothetical protein